MQTEWNLRFELLELAHRWQIAVLLFIAGSVIGWAFSLFFPSDYRAEVPLYVAYREDAVYRNPDDYKNWQMRQLTAFTITDEVLIDTLERLRFADPYWNEIHTSQFRDMTRVLWRNTGKWRLVIEHPDPAYSAQAVNTWTIVFLEHYQTARQNAVRNLELATVLQENLAVQNQLELLLQRQQVSLQVTIDAETLLNSIPADQSVPIAIHYELLGRLSTAADAGSGWEFYLKNPPEPQSTASTYLSWITGGRILLETEISQTEHQIGLLQQEYAELEKEFEATNNASRGLSAHLEVDREWGGPVYAESIRPTELIALVGGTLGILIWTISWMVGPVRRILIHQ